MSMEIPVICARDLTKRYGGIEALKGLSFVVPGRTVYALLGRNGAGKTTTLRILLGLCRPTSGSAQVFGLDARAERVRILRRCGFVSESKSLYSWMTAEDLMRFMRGFYDTWSDEAAVQYVRRLEIPTKVRWADLSRGNQTKVYVLLALAQSPEILFLDEPTSGLDPVTAEDLLEILREECHSRGRTVIFSSHQLDEVERLADRIAIIHRGRLILEASLADIQNHFRIATIAGKALPAGTQAVLAQFVEGETIKVILAHSAEAVLTQLRQRGVRLIRVDSISLRELFLRLVAREE
jgi:ABC-2 type transport system ATP-binding protein